MNYLFIDTADGTRALVFANGKYYYDENTKKAGAEALMPMIDSLLKRANISVSDLGILGACIGPGSFTGIRIGLATVKTLCYALDKPCFAVNNLQLNSYNSKSDKVVSVADAGNKVCYIACLVTDVWTESPKCVTRDEAIAIVNARRAEGYAVSTDTKLAGVFGDGASGVGEREMRFAAEKRVEYAMSYKELLPLYIRKAQPDRGEGDL